MQVGDAGANPLLIAQQDGGGDLFIQQDVTRRILPWRRTGAVQLRE
jgi:hypothetical protein